MKVALIANERSVASIKGVIKEANDSVVLHSYNTIEQFIRQSASQALVFDRLIIISTALTKEERSESQFSNLNRYLMTKTPRTILLFVNRYTDKNNDPDKVLRELFFSIFTSVLYIDISIDKQSAVLVKALVTKDVDTMRLDYSKRPHEDIDVIDDFIDIEEPEEVEESKEVQAAMGIMKYGSQAGIFKRKKQQTAWQRNAAVNDELIKTLQER